MPAGTADVAEPAAHEVAGVARVAEIAHRDDERVVDDAGDHRPLHVFELQVEVGDVRDEVFARRLADKRAEHVLHHAAVLPRLDDEIEPLGGDFRALHLADHRRVGERIQIREGVEVGAVGLPVEEQRVGLDRVEHRRRRPLRDVDVNGAQVLGQNRGGRSVVGPDVLEDGVVAGLLRVMIDHQVDLRQQPGKVMRLHVDERDAIERS